MGQVTLGIRSLFFKIAVFVVMASLLAWALGGTLLPRPESAVWGQSVEFDGTAHFWELTVGGKEETIAWRLLAETKKKPRVVDDRSWKNAAGPWLIDGNLVYGGQPAGSGGEWVLVERSPGGAVVSHAVLDRLALEQQRLRLQRGLPVQSIDLMNQQRDLVIDPSHDVTAAHDGSRASRSEP